MSKIDDERVKLTATFLNGVAVAMFAAGVIVPLAAFTYGVPGSASGGIVAFVGFGWAVAGLLAHSAARRHLRRMTP